jgi:hypothetical protein
VRVTFVPETATELTVLAVELTLTEKDEAAGTMLARAMLYVITKTEGEALSITELTYTGTGAATLLVTSFAVNDAACPPAEVCRGLVEGLV